MNLKYLNDIITTPHAVDLPKLMFWGPMYSEVINCCVRDDLPTPAPPRIAIECIVGCIGEILLRLLQNLLI